MLRFLINSVSLSCQGADPVGGERRLSNGQIPINFKKVIKAIQSLEKKITFVSFFSFFLTLLTQIHFH